MPCGDEVDERDLAVIRIGVVPVLVNGMGQSNPTAQQVVAEYKRTKQ